LHRLPEHWGYDHPAVRDKKFEQFRRMFRPGEAVGYFTEDSPDGNSKRCVAQYAMAPVILLAWAPLEFVITDYESGGESNKPEMPGNYELAADCGNGLKLYKRRTWGK